MAETRQQIHDGDSKISEMETISYNCHEPLLRCSNLKYLNIETNWIYFQILHVPESHVTMVVPVSYQGLLGFAGVDPGTGEHLEE
jgi:hypothetical protein